MKKIPSRDSSNYEVLYSNRNESLDYVYDMALADDDSENDSPASITDQPALDAVRYRDPVWINGGGMKDIYKVFDSVTRRPVAMACLKEGYSSRHEKIFRREAYLTAYLEHPNIMPVYDIGTDLEGRPFFTMKLTGDHNLADLIRENGKDLDAWPLFHRLNLFLEVCAGVNYAHSKHIIHMDLKPGNIQIGDFGEVLICDWGLAKFFLDRFSESDIREGVDSILFIDPVEPDSIKGTPGFMAPEQIEQGSGACSMQTDIYALGAILYVLLTGDYPVEGRTMSILENTVNGEFSSGILQGGNSSIPYALNAVILKAAALNPEDRYSSVGKLSEDIQAFMGGFATQAENAGVIRSAALLVKRNKILFSTILLIFTVCIGFIVRLRISERAAKQALQMYLSEREAGMKLKKQSLPNLIQLSDAALIEYDFKKAEALLDKALKLNPESKAVREKLGYLQFYEQKFNAALDSLRKAGISENDTIYKLSEKFALRKKDNTLLKNSDFIMLLKSFRYYNGAMRILMAYYRQHYTNLQEYLESVKTVFEILHRKHVHFVFTVKNGKNCLDLSGNEGFAKPKLDLIDGLPLHELNLEGLQISYFDTKFLVKMPLEKVNLDTPVRVELSLLSKIPTLKQVILNKKLYSAEELKVIPGHVKIVLK